MKHEPVNNHAERKRISALIERCEKEQTMEKIYRVQMNSKGMPNFATAEEIPQGEWIRTGRTNIYGGIEVQCSNCGDKVMVQHLEDEWFCRHCGADMGMKGADDE